MIDQLRLIELLLRARREASSSDLERQAGRIMVLTMDLTKAARRGDLEVLVDAYANGFDVEDRDFSGWSLLERATFGGCIHVQRGTASLGATATINAMRRRWLIARGADVNAARAPGRGASYRAGDVPPSQVNDVGMSPLHLMHSKGPVEAAMVLLDAGAEVNACDDFGRTPLMRAVIDSHADFVRLLLSRSADYDHRDKVGRSCDAFGQSYNYDPSIRRLIAAVRSTGGWAKYVLFPRKRVLALRVLCEQGRASTDDSLLRRLFPAAPPPAAGIKRTRVDYRAAKGGRLPRGIFWLILEFWRNDRDYPA